MTISDQLRRAIDRSGLSRYQIALDADVDQASLSRFMNGADITTKTFDAIAAVLGLSLVEKR